MGGSAGEPYPDVPCCKCKKMISDEEYVVNWGTCNECFDRDYNEYLSTMEYLKNNPPKDDEDTNVEF